MIWHNDVAQWGIMCHPHADMYDMAKMKEINLICIREKDTQGTRTWMGLWNIGNDSNALIFIKLPLPSHPTPTAPQPTTTTKFFSLSSVILPPTPSKTSPSTKPVGDMHFNFSDISVGKEALTSYHSRIQSLGKPNLLSLDDFYRNQLPPFILQWNPNPHITTYELVKLM